MGSIPLCMTWILASLYILDAKMLSRLDISECNLRPHFIRWVSGFYRCEVGYWVEDVNVYLEHVSGTDTITIQLRNSHGHYVDVHSEVSPYHYQFTTPIGNSEYKIRTSNEQSYELIFERPENGNNYASSINLTYVNDYNVSANCDLVPKYEKTVRDYNCTVGTEVSEVAVSYKVEDKWAQLDFYEGGKELEFFQANLARVVIFAQNDAKGEYKFNIFRTPDPDANLRALTVPDCLWEPLQPTFNIFDPPSYYECRIFWNITNLQFKVERNSTRSRVNLFESNRNLRVGTNDIHLEVVAHDKIHKTSFDFFVIRGINPLTTDDSSLTAMSFTNCSLNRLFRTQIERYACNSIFPNERRILTKSDFTIETSDPNSTWFLEGTNPTKPFNNTINLTVLSEDKTTTTKYQIDLFREPNSDATLRNMTISTHNAFGKELVAAYSGCFPNINIIPGQFNYSCTVDYLVRTILFVTSTNDDEALANPPFQNVTLNLNANIAIVDVTASNLINTTTYNFSIFRRRPENNSMISSLTIPGCTLDPAFDSQITTYTCIMTKEYDSIRPTVILASNRSTFTISYPTSAVASNETYAYYGYNEVQIMARAESLWVTTYSVYLTRIFESAINQPINTFENLKLMFIEWDFINTDATNSTQMKEILGTVISAIDTSGLSPDVPKNRLAVVGIRPTQNGQRLNITFTVIPRTNLIDFDLRPNSRLSDHDVEAMFLFEIKKYQDRGNTKFINPDIKKMSVASQVVSKSGTMKLFWPVKYRVSQVLGPIPIIGIPSTTSSLSSLSLPGCDFIFFPTEYSYNCLTNSHTKEPKLVFTLVDPDYSVSETTILTDYDPQYFYFGHNTIRVNVTAEDRSYSVYQITLTRSFENGVQGMEVTLFKDLEVLSTEWENGQDPLNGQDRYLNTDNENTMRDLTDAFIAYVEHDLQVTPNRLAVVGISKASVSSLNIDVAVMPFIGTPSGSDVPSAQVFQEYSHFVTSKGKTLRTQNITMQLFNITSSNYFRVSQALGNTLQGTPSSETKLQKLSVSGCNFLKQFKSSVQSYYCIMDNRVSKMVLTIDPIAPRYVEITVSDSTLNGENWIQTKISHSLKRTLL